MPAEIPSPQCSSPECGVERFLLLLDGPWATLIVRELLAGPLRFSVLRSKLKGISAHTLTNRLRKFETNGLVTRTVFAEIPPRVVYELTPFGASLKPLLYAMNDWGLAVPKDVLDRSVRREPVDASFTINEEPTLNAR